VKESLRLSWKKCGRFCSIKVHEGKVLRWNVIPEESSYNVYLAEEEKGYLPIEIKGTVVNSNI
jgi:hypothetical protein